MGIPNARCEVWFPVPLFIYGVLHIVLISLRTGSGHGSPTSVFVELLAGSKEGYCVAMNVVWPYGPGHPRL